MNDFSVRIEKTAGDALGFELRTFDPDHDDEAGCARDYGTTIVEGGEIVGDGTRDGYDTKKILQIASVIEHAPDMLSLLEALNRESSLQGVRPTIRIRIQQVLAAIKAGELKYPPQV